MPIGHLYVFSGEVSLRSSAHFFYWVVGFIVIELYELFVYFGN